MEENLCPFCQTVDEVLEDIEIAESYEEKFEILHSVLDQISTVAFKEGFKQAIKDQIENLEDVLEEIEVEEDCDCCDGNCETCKDD